MQGQTVIPTQDTDELLISTIVRLIQRRAFPNLRNIIAKTHSADIARWFPRLRAESKSSLFKILIEDEASADVEHLLGYEEKTAGAIMTPNFF